MLNLFSFLFFLVSKEAGSSVYSWVLDTTIACVPGASLPGRIPLIILHDIGVGLFSVHGGRSLCMVWGSGSVLPHTYIPLCIYVPKF